VIDDLLGMRMVGALGAAACAAVLARTIVRPTPKLASRVRPYVAPSRSALGRAPDRATVAPDAPVSTHGVLARIVRPMLDSLVATVTRVFGVAFDDEGLALKLRQAGLLLDVPEHERVHEHRVRQVGAGVGWGIAVGTLGLLVQGSAGVAFGAFVLGIVIGVSRRAARISTRIASRRERMRVELYTINQLLAIYLRTSGSPVLAAQRLVRRGKGAVIDDLDEALRLHARGMSAARAFGRIAEQTPEPFAARTYKLLASGSERGADLAGALLTLSEDLRDARRTNVRRAATRRQATMLIPIICFLAPVMLLFILAPIPALVAGATH